MKTVIKMSEWLRGEGPYASSLLREADNKMCCLGFRALSSGATKGEICGVSVPEDTSGVRWPMWLVRSGHFGNRTPECCALMKVNDDRSTSDEYKRSEIVRIFFQNGEEVEFIP